jgi:hypothetical protein
MTKAYMRRVLFGFTLTSLFATQTMHGAAMQFKFDHTFDGMAPTGKGPWISATFQDVSPGIVDLTVSDISLTKGEFLGALDFNLDPLLNANQLKFQVVSETPGFANPSILEGADIFKGDIGGCYDIQLGFCLLSGARFGAGDSITYQITGIPQLDADSFDFLSKSTKGSKSFLAAAEIQGMCDTPGWVNPSQGVSPVPEPSSFALVAIGAGLGMGIRRLRRSVRG